MKLVIEVLFFVLILHFLYLNWTVMGIDNERKELTKIHNTRGMLVKQIGEHK
jgi:hypothetical protein